MNYLFSILMLLMLVPHNQKLPDEFQQLPAEVREKATVIFEGTYGERRGPPVYIGGGTTAWRLESYFDVKKVYRGKVVAKTILINSRVSPKINDVSVNLKSGRDYLVLLRPNEKSMKLISSRKYISVHDRLQEEELIAIVELEQSGTDFSL